MKQLSDDKTDSIGVIWSKEVFSFFSSVGPSDLTLWRSFFNANGRKFNKMTNLHSTVLLNSNEKSNTFLLPTFGARRWLWEGLPESNFRMDKELADRAADDCVTMKGLYTIETGTGAFDCRVWTMVFT